MTTCWEDGLAHSKNNLEITGRRKTSDKPHKEWGEHITIVAVSVAKFSIANAPYYHRRF